MAFENQSPAKKSFKKTLIEIFRIPPMSYQHHQHDQHKVKGIWATYLVANLLSFNWHLQIYSWDCLFLSISRLNRSVSSTILLFNNHNYGKKIRNRIQNNDDFLWRFYLNWTANSIVQVTGIRQLQTRSWHGMLRPPRKTDWSFDLANEVALTKFWARMLQDCGARENANYPTLLPAAQE